MYEFYRNPRASRLALCAIIKRIVAAQQEARDRRDAGLSRGLLGSSSAGRVTAERPARAEPGGEALRRHADAHDGLHDVRRRTLARRVLEHGLPVLHRDPAGL